mmetsp:Transcript_7584/g.18769  ORF Transcript_7584/g.18769 Transcript_7584/m.18769 type:complete len:307 (-) Transcript_7584:2647-3567(-)
MGPAARHPAASSAAGEHARLHGRRRLAAGGQPVGGARQASHLRLRRAGLPAACGGGAAALPSACRPSSRRASSRIPSAWRPSSRRTAPRLPSAWRASSGRASAWVPSAWRPSSRWASSGRSAWRRSSACEGTRGRQGGDDRVAAPAASNSVPRSELRCDQQRLTALARLHHGDGRLIQLQYQRPYPRHRPPVALRVDQHPHRRRRRWRHDVPRVLLVGAGQGDRLQLHLRRARAHLRRAQRTRLPHGVDARLADAPHPRVVLLADHRRHLRDRLHRRCSYREGVGMEAPAWRRHGEAEKGGRGEGG